MDFIPKLTADLEGRVKRQTDGVVVVDLDGYQLSQFSCLIDGHTVIINLPLRRRLKRQRIARRPWQPWWAPLLAYFCGMLAGAVIFSAGNS